MGDAITRRTFVAAAASYTGLLVGGCDLEPAQPARPEEIPSALAQPLRAANAETLKLYQVVERYFDELLALNPIYATQLGDHRFDDRFGDYVSASWMADSLGIEQESLERLQAVDRKQLAGDDLVTHQAFKQQRAASIGGYRYPSELLALDQVASWPNVFAQLGSGTGAQPFRTTLDYDNFLARMGGFAAWVDQSINNLRSGVAKGVVLPKLVVARTLPQLDAFGRVEEPRSTVFWQPLLRFPPAPSVADRRRLLEAYESKLRTQVLPAYRRLHDYLAQEYLPQARDSIGWAELPGGDLWYAWLVRYHTSSDYTPDEVHAMGLHEVARLRAESAPLLAALALPGDERAAFDALRTDPKFRFDGPASLLAGYAAARARVEANLPSSFHHRSKAGLEIRPMEPYRADAAPMAAYERGSADATRAGILYINAHDLAAHPAYLVDALYLQEGVPGRHYQAALAQDAPTLPRVRRFGATSAYESGWALYAASLGRELGTYADPYGEFGAWTLELWHAAMLVVDTGVHAKGWTRQHALEYLRANVALGETAIAAEVERCIARPGEAIAYTIGAIKIRELRRRAQQQLGTRFELREFHDQVVGGGALPLRVLDAKFERWFAARH